MKKRISKTKIVAAVLCLASAFTVVLAEPGGTDDPLISKSYIENVLMPQIKEYVETKISQVNSGGGTQTASSFKVVNMTSGQKLICDAGAELILRMGSADIIATEKGGLADTTAGFDLANGTQMPSNHLLIVPVADGRGMVAKNDVIVMVKGGYTIK
ncbi:MAG: hypothetical protein IKW62_05255 [Clostridia bacterium]|nr:hypothetical protein [Clostridia bacterium]